MTGGHDREHRVRVRAYHLWETEGRPEGREAEFWHRAAELDYLESAASQDSGITSQLESEFAPMTPAKKPRAKAPPAASAAKPKQPAKQAAAPKAASRKRASAPVLEGAQKSNSARAQTRPAEHP